MIMKKIVHIVIEIFFLCSSFATYNFLNNYCFNPYPCRTSSFRKLQFHRMKKHKFCLCFLYFRFLFISQHTPQPIVVVVLVGLYFSMNFELEFLNNIFLLFYTKDTFSNGMCFQMQYIMRNNKLNEQNIKK